MLSVIRGGARKTRIMYQANLSYKLLVRYLDFTLKSGLVSLSSESEELYIVTRKGKEFLDQYRRFSEHSMELEKKLNDIKREKAFLINTFIGRLMSSAPRDQISGSKDAESDRME